MHMDLHSSEHNISGYPELDEQYVQRIISKGTKSSHQINMSDTRKDIVKQGYDNMADDYLSWVESQDSPRTRYTEKVLANTTSNTPSILELGCGAGRPITRMLLDHGARVTANDISEKQVNLAKAACPEATIIAGDMLALHFDPSSFDGIVGFFSVFHLPRDQQKDMLTKVLNWLKPGGLLAFNLGTSDQEEIRGNFLGHDMYWSSYGVEYNLKMIKEIGFQVVEHEILEAGDGKLDESDPDYGVKFLWIVARKP